MGIARDFKRKEWLMQTHHAMWLIAVVLIGALSMSAWAQDAASRPPTKEPEVVRLWQGAAPGAQGTQDVDVPTLTIYRAPADRATGAAIVVFPGGGYQHLAEHEGKPVAQWLNTLGITSAVL